MCAYLYDKQGRHHFTYSQLQHAQGLRMLSFCRKLTGGWVRAMIENEIDFELAEVSDNGISIGWHGNAVLLRKGLSERACKGGIGSLPIWSDILVPDATC